MGPKPRVNNMKDEILSYLFSHDNGRYDREHFDEFLAKKSFFFDIPAIHVTGTNGKGAVTAYLESIYRAAGYNVASYRSPYLYSPCEMMTYNGEHISEEAFERLFEIYKKDFEKYELSAFEIETYIAFMFMIQRCPTSLISYVRVSNTKPFQDRWASSPISILRIL